MTARLPGSVALRERIMPISITVRDGMQASTPVYFDLSWNLDPHEAQSFRVTASYTSEGAIKASKLLVSVDGKEPRSFPPKSEQIVLLNIPIHKENRQGHQQHSIEFMLDTTSDPKLADGEYRGWLMLATEQQ